MVNCINFINFEAHNFAMERKIMFMGVIAVLLLSLFYVGSDMTDTTGLVVEDASRYQQITDCVETGKSLNECRLEAGVISLEEYEAHNP